MRLPWDEQDKRPSAFSNVNAMHRGAAAKYRAMPRAERRAKADEPFFLYFSMTSPHEPVVPSKPFLGKSGIAPIADFVMETDWSAGQIIQAIDGALSQLREAEALGHERYLTFFIGCQLRKEKSSLLKVFSDLNVFCWFFRCRSFTF